MAKSRTRCNSVEHSEPSGAMNQLPRRPTIAVLCALIAILYGALAVGVERAAQARHAAPVAVYHSRLVFDASIPPADRQWIVQSVAQARPEAIRLIGKVDAETDVTLLRALPGSWLGYAQRIGAGRFQVSLNLDQLDGVAAADRAIVVLHELGHVVDGLLVPHDLR